ncbi:hypothetical protein A6769_12170 [Nostoc punctiforme NIES-2108]|uniref:Uncharacterized protein n=1 Tax=Nostoc punctiforme NIES-2108 TaxID=1356359 RepID=A0A367RPJ8_NOSPU|nr:hypothetical protein A6769_12170 [Nostoc punctiforme NIES-2108]
MEVESEIKEFPSKYRNPGWDYAKIYENVGDSLIDLYRLSNTIGRKQDASSEFDLAIATQLDQIIAKLQLAKGLIKTE